MADEGIDIVAGGAAKAREHRLLRFLKVTSAMVVGTVVGSCVAFVGLAVFITSVSRNDHARELKIGILMDENVIVDLESVDSCRKEQSVAAMQVLAMLQRLPPGDGRMFHSMGLSVPGRGFLVTEVKMDNGAGWSRHLVECRGTKLTDSHYMVAFPSTLTPPALAGQVVRDTNKYMADTPATCLLGIIGEPPTLATLPIMREGEQDGHEARVILVDGHITSVERRRGTDGTWAVSESSCEGAERTDVLSTAPAQPIPN